jgi:hypothetical protein
MSSLKRSLLGTVLWWGMLLLTFVTAAYLCILCLPYAVSAQSVSAEEAMPTPAPSPSPLNVDPSSSHIPPQVDANFSLVQARIAALDARTNEMSKRIEELGNHATRILSLIGLLVGFITGVVGIGLWQSKQYIDRVVDHYKIEMKSYIKEETEKQLGDIKTQMSTQFKETLNQTIEELNKGGELALQGLKAYENEANTSLQSLAESRIESNLRLGILLIERIPQIFNKAIDIAHDRGLVSENDQVASKDEMEFTIYAQKEILRALVQLESSNVSEVIAGCHKLSALQDRACLPALKLALSKWSQTGDQRVIDQISASYEKLMSVQV